jgi:hypothetical protein
MDKDKKDAILAMVTPMSKNALQRFIGCVK